MTFLHFFAYFNHLYRTMRYAPFLIGLAGCLLPDARYTLGNETYSTRIAGEYGGWSVMIILFLFAVITFIHVKLKKPVSWLLTGMAGIYLLGFALFRAWHTFTLYAKTEKESLATHVGATAVPGEGLVLLAICGAWLWVNAIRGKKNPHFQPTIE
jgi:hypothetical protein